MKRVRVESHEDPVEVTTNARVLDAVLATREKLLMACGGKGLCATCHVYVDEVFTDRVGGAGDLEDDMLDGAAAERLPNSRLSCQIKMRDELDGLLVRIAPEQL